MLLNVSVHALPTLTTFLGAAPHPMQTMMQKWHWGVPLDQVKRGNVADLMAYGFWYRSREELEAEGQGHLPDQLVTELEQAWGISFPEGHTPGLPFMSHLWQDINCHYR